MEDVLVALLHALVDCPRSVMFHSVLRELRHRGISCSMKYEMTDDDLILQLNDTVGSINVLTKEVRLKST